MNFSFQTNKTIMKRGGFNRINKCSKLDLLFDQHKTKSRDVRLKLQQKIYNNNNHKGLSKVDL